MHKSLPVKSLETRSHTSSSGELKAGCSHHSVVWFAPAGHSQEVCPEASHLQAQACSRRGGGSFVWTSDVRMAEGAPWSQQHAEPAGKGGVAFKVDEGRSGSPYHSA